MSLTTKTLLLPTLNQPAPFMQTQRRVVTAEDQHVLAFDVDLGAAELAVHDLVADLHGNGNEVAVLVELALAHGQNGTALGLFLRLRREEQTRSGVSSASSCLTITRSPRGFKFITLPSFRPTYARTVLSHVRYLTTQQW